MSASTLEPGVEQLMRFRSAARRRLVLADLLREPTFDRGDPEVLLEEQHEFYEQGDRQAAYRAAQICIVSDRPIVSWAKEEVNRVLSDGPQSKRRDQKKRGRNADFQEERLAEQRRLVVFVAVDMLIREGVAVSKAARMAKLALEKDGFFYEDGSIRNIYRQMRSRASRAPRPLLEFFEISLLIAYREAFDGK